MIAPLYVPTVILSKAVEDDVCTGTTIEDVTKNMQLVDNKTLNDIGDSYNKVVCTSDIDNRLDDAFNVCTLVMVGVLLMQEFLNNV